MMVEEGRVGTVFMDPVDENEVRRDVRSGNTGDAHEVFTLVGEDDKYCCCWCPILLLAVSGGDE